MVLLFGNTPEDEFPSINFSRPLKSIKNLNTYYTNNFGLKSQMVDSYLKFKLHILNDPPLPNRVVTGKEDWYFLGNQYNKLFNDSFGNHSFSIGELEKIKSNIEAIKNELESKGIAFHIVVPPNKHRVYSDKLPYNLNQKPTRLEELNSYLKKEIDFELLDLREALISNKDKGLLFYKTDTHWTDLGAFIGYQKTLNALNLNVPKDFMTNYDLNSKQISRGDITEMINIESKENAIFFSQRTTSEIIQLESKWQHLRYKNPNRDKKLIMYRDSFSNAWIRFFNESFGETIYLREYNINPDLIHKEKPDVIIFEIVERELGSVLLNLYTKKGLQN